MVYLFPNIVKKIHFFMSTVCQTWDNFVKNYTFVNDHFSNSKTFFCTYLTHIDVIDYPTPHSVYSHDIMINYNNDFFF